MKKLFLVFAIVLLVLLIFTYPKEKNVKVYFHNEGISRKIPLEEYIKGTVSAEMGASFHIEALKAQAVASRTYTYSKLDAKDTAHPLGAVVCTDSTHCQAYMGKDDIPQNHRRKIAQAVQSTRGEIVIFDGEPIRALFHATSHGQTESSKDVFGGDFPYLQSVPSAFDSLCPQYKTQAKFKKTDLATVLGVDGDITIGKTERTTGGAVKNIEISENTYSGRELRQKLNLRSTCFDVKQTEDEIIFAVTGYGHGVGLSQWGAEGMARSGENYKSILNHYYKGTEIEKIY